MVGLNTSVPLDAVSMGRLDRGISKARCTAAPIDPTEDGADVRGISVIGILVIDDISLIASSSGASLGMKAALMAPEYGVGSASPETAILTGASVDVRVGVIAANGIGAASMTGTAPIAGAVAGGDDSVDAVGLYTGGLYE